MAVKPITQPEYWATDAVYTTGPFVGQPQKVIPPGAFAAEGHRPGSLFPTPAEYENSQQYNLTGLARWVFLGSSAGAADAHPLETDSNGEGQVERWRVVPANAHSYALFVQAPPGAGFAIQATGGSLLGDATIIGATTGSGPGVEGTATSTGPAMRATASGAGTALEVEAAGSGRAMDVTGGTGTTAATVTGGAGQAAMLVSGGNNAAVAAQFIGAGTSLGIVASGGATSANATGVRGDALHTDAVGVHGRTAVTGSFFSAGVRGEGRGAESNGVHALSTAGRGLLVQGDTSSPAYPAMRIMPQDADPTAGTMDGDTIWHGDHKTLRTCVAGYGYRSMPTMGPGSAFLVSAAQAVGAVDAVGGVYGTLLTVTCSTLNGTGFYGSAASAEVLITLSLSFRSVVASSASEYLNIKITDVTNAAPIAEWTGAGPGAGAAFSFIATTDEWLGSVSVGVRYNPPTDGDLEILIEASRPAPNNNLEIRNAVVDVKGTF